MNEPINITVPVLKPISANKVFGKPNELSLHDWFAGMAMQGLLASGHFTYEPDEEEGHGAWMCTHSDEYDNETGEEIHKGRRKFDFPEAAWRCATVMMEARKAPSGLEG